MDPRAQRLPVPARLRPWVRSIDMARVNAAATQTMVRPPEVRSTLVWRALASGEQDLVLVGPHTRASYHADKNLQLVVTFVLRIGAMQPLLGVLPEMVRDRGVPLHDLTNPAARRIAARLLALPPEPDDVIRAVAAALLGPERPEPVKQALMLSAAAALSTTSEPAVRIGALARDLAISERQLRARFTRAVGIGPKHFARVSRLRTALTELRDRPGAEVAVATGYSDQSHMAAEFQRLMRIPPSAYIAGQLPAPERC